MTELKEDNLYHDVPDNDGVRAALEKARQIAGLEWTPIRKVPKYSYDYFEANKTHQGVPYSSGSELRTLIGLDVSLYSFLSSLDNKYSYIYTEDLSKSPYRGLLSRPYFGLVCSSAVDVVLGLPVQYPTKMFDSLPFFSKKKTRSVNSVRLCDILLQPDHVAMVYDIARDKKNDVVSVTIFESTPPAARLFEYSAEDFEKEWKRRWSVLTYDNIKDNTIDKKYFNLDSYNPASKKVIYTAKGDRVAYSVKDSISFFVADKGYEVMKLYRDNLFVDEIALKNGKITLYDLSEGLYEAFVGEETDEHKTEFEVIDASATISVGDPCEIHFGSSNAVPVYSCFSKGDFSGVAYHLFTEDEILKGAASVEFPGEESKYFRVVFEGKFGRVSSPLVAL